MSKLVILGAQESGVGAARLAQRQGVDVFVSDAGAIKPEYRRVLQSNGIEFEEGGHSAARVLEAHEVVKSPGIPDTASLVVAAKNKGIPVISEIEFAYRYCKGTIVAITGSNGKTTTTLLMHHILQKAGVDVVVGGNVGTSFAGLVADGDNDVYVLELSSFQLDGIREFRPHIAMLLNITPDHLDRYQQHMPNYVASKFRITMNQTAQDHFIHSADDPEINGWMRQHTIKARHWPFSIERSMDQGAIIKNDQLTITTDKSTFSMSMIELALKGKHNIYNSMAAGIGARLLELRKEPIREALADFQNVEHRLEHVAMVHGIEFINDSKATNVNSVWYALESISKPMIWLVGGVDKGNDYTMLRDLVKNRVKAIVCMGTDNAAIHAAFDGLVPTITDTNSAEQAVRTAYEMAEAGDVVLLSPACASFDLFENYEDRGRKFKAAVRGL
ncbi:MAG: UDP-N-acetylmuramoyl-L-alanine--D-glutamate ligase [Flavobacteriales bacterium]|jgi:UDP-N-acetylmuramoylalanine--D-glutamate ligase|nr:UDP-N-acetylmuramoyl-L-alanine--D-glutamate ligase [Flavobacteriales bacterium]MBP6641765.1 UDP-N-acetylmuramoyl-L-alanine--D-glutamate ligase [Flavobacteriales bacterium]MBP7156366.1 UDP-N-acetylmuramoyl-L-alanine--D-glutamate ligase [Flavobacteriales bacterium]HQV74920.1 UDP-N-acetylmuramoyl-L-alanine--D-glutamate ligase [Flavobacteriales bacterium]HQW40872.1 UDP-N-acetylmuramoyl-L-alanine--D-glutamate ligase [Flavobacteriales bacterium]